MHIGSLPVECVSQVWSKYFTVVLKISSGQNVFYGVKSLRDSSLLLFLLLFLLWLPYWAILSFCPIPLCLCNETVEQRFSDTNNMWILAMCTGEWSRYPGCPRGNTVVCRLHQIWKGYNSLHSAWLPYKFNCQLHRHQPALFGGTVPLFGLLWAMTHL